MAKLNKKKNPIHTHEGATAKHINSELQLRRSVMACLLWEDEFYENGQIIANRIASLVQMVRLSCVTFSFYAMPSRKIKNRKLFGKSL